MNLLDPSRADGRIFHLSTLLCGRHRREVLDTVRGRLEAGEPTLLITTTVVEAGVDIDFPLLFRALAPLPNLIQAAGRCNREGRLEGPDGKPLRGEAIIFIPADDATPTDKVYLSARERTRFLLERAERKGKSFPFDDPNTITDWFRDVYADLDLDAYSVRKSVRAYRFAEVAQNMRLIRDDTVPVLAEQYAREKGQAILDEAEKKGGLNRELWRKLQPLCVSVYARQAQDLYEPFPGLRLWPGKYDPKTGIPLLSDPSEAAYGIVYQTERLIVDSSHD
jgi:CRISPR-associated endonuclease/helicase Cas3